MNLLDFYSSSPVETKTTGFDIKNKHDEIGYTLGQNEEGYYI